jgi:hypothetical protein
LHFPGKTEIVKPEDQPLFLKPGQTLNLECVQYENHNIQWRKGKAKDAQLLKNGENGFEIMVYKHVQQSRTITHSILRKPNVGLSDKDPYVCQPEDNPLQGTYIDVDVLESECSTRCCNQRSNKSCCILFILYLG